jgi:putative acetyltransferase
VIVRDERDTDAPAVRRVIIEAFGRPRVADLAAALRARPDRGAGLVAEDAGEVIGCVHLSTSWVDASRALVEVLVLSPLAVRPDRQRAGVGRALVAAALAAAEQFGAPALFLEGDPAYYSRFGFEAAAGRGFTPPSTRIPAAGFQAVVLPSWQPWMTGALVYNDTFWSHDCVGLRADEP